MWEDLKNTIMLIFLITQMAFIVLFLIIFLPVYLIVGRFDSWKEYFLKWFR